MAKATAKKKKAKAKTNTRDAQATKGGPHPGDTFASQAHALARAYRDYKLVAQADGQKYQPADIERLADEQKADEDAWVKVEKHYNEFRVGYQARAAGRARQLSAALKAARGLLAGNEKAIEDLKGARFNTGSSRKAGAKDPGTGSAS